MDDHTGQMELSQDLPPPIQASSIRRPPSIKDTQSQHNGSSISVDSNKRDSASSKRDPPLPPRKATNSHPTLPPRSPSNRSGTVSLDSSFNASHFPQENSLGESLLASEITHPQQTSLQTDIPGINPLGQTDIPLTVRMEMAFQQATIENKKENSGENPWDEDNVWT